MLNQVKMKECAVVEFEVDEVKTKNIIYALKEAIESLKSEVYKDEFTDDSICTLLNLEGMFESIKADFKD